MTTISGTNNTDWTAKWITRAVSDHKRWENYTAEVDAAIERRGAGVLFGFMDERNFWECELNAETGEVALYSMVDGVRTELARAEADELKAAPARLMVKVAAGEQEVRVDLAGRPALAAAAPSRIRGTVGFRAREGGAAVFRELRIFDDSGRALYVNRFYDPALIQFTSGRIDSSGNGLRLEEGETALCEAPTPADSPLFRKSFAVAGEVAGAVVRVYSTGWYELTVNGRKPDGRVLAPANTPYERRMLYDTYDVTDLLREGGNAVGLWLGNGYNMNYSRWGWKWRRDKAAIMQLDIRFRDGSVQRVATDETWRTADSPLLMNDIYDGERFDGRLVRAGWDRHDFDDGDWRNVLLADGPPGELEPNSQPPVRAWEPLEPVRVWRTRDGASIYDFGQNIAGWVKAEAEGEAGSRLVLRYSELIDADGRIDPWTNRNAMATDEYRFAGNGVETYEPRFTYHGFRYVEATGAADRLRLRAVPIHADVREIGRFRCSDELVNRIQSNIRWSFLNNLVSIPTDCCQRDERTPCLMDSAVVEEAAIHNFDMAAYYRKWLGDIGDSMTNPDWSGDKVTLPWYLYWYCGDTETLSRHFGTMKAYVDHLAEKWPQRIVEEGFGDWCPPNDDGWDNYFGEVSLVNTALFYRQAQVVADAAGILGREADERRCRELADSVKRSFLERFDAGGGKIGSGSQTAQLMPLAFGMLPEPLAAQAAQVLVAAIEENGNRLDTGIYGTRYLMDVLADYGRIDLAMELLTQPEYPGFGYQIAQGATTLWEQWSMKGGMHSHDHVMFGGIGVSFYTRLGGIRPLAPGYGSIMIEPHVPRSLEWAETSIDTVKGRIVSNWRKEGDRLHVEVEIPPGAEAVVSLPASGGGRVTREAGPGKHRYTV